MCCEEKTKQEIWLEPKTFGMTSFASDRGGKAWIGLHIADPNTGYVWSDGSPVSKLVCPQCPSIQLYPICTGLDQMPSFFFSFFR